MTQAKNKQLRDAELTGQLEKFPAQEEVEELCSVLRISTLREMTAEIVNGGMEHAKGNIDRL